MRCQACNVILTPVQSVRKFESGEFVDLCDKCLGTIQDQVSYDEPELPEESDDE